MSLVNQVLQDLAKRSKVPFESEIVLFDLEPYIAVSESVKWGKKQWMALWLFIVFLVGLFFLQMYPAEQSKLFIPILKNTNEGTNTEESPEQLSVTTYPTMVKDVLLDSQNDTTTLRFLLTQEALYHIVSDSDLHKIFLTLEDTRILNKLSTFNYDKSALSDATLNSRENGDLAVGLSLREGAEIKRIELIQSDSSPELQLEIFYHAPVSKVTVLQKPIVKPLATSMPPTTNKVIATELKAQALVDQGKFSQALNLLKKMNPPMEFYPDYYSLLAAIYQHEGSAIQAAALYRKLLTTKPDQSKWWVDLGVALETVGKNSEALEAYTAAKNTKINLTPELQTYIENRIDNL